MKTLLKLGLPLLLALALPTAVILLTRSQPGDETQAGAWTCSMHPQIRKAGPGRCPICGMDLVPVALASSEKERIEKRAGILVEPVAYREVFKEIRTVGKLDYNERQTAYITARIAGRVDKVFADFSGVQVKKDDHLVEIYSPDLIVTMQNLLDGLMAGNKSMVEVARQRLSLWGMLPEQIAALEKSRKIQTHLTVFAPRGGTVIEKMVRPGQYVKEGDVLYRIADLDPLWLFLDLYEYDLGWIRIGQRVDVTVEAYPGEHFPGRLVFLDPVLDDKTRTLRVRVNMPNAERRLKPAMYAAASIRIRLQADGTPEATGLEGKYLCPMHPEVVRGQPGECPYCHMPLEQVPPLKVHETHAAHAGIGKVLAIRASAVLDTGRRKVAYRHTAEGAYELVELQLGPRADGKDETGKRVSYYPVRSGLKEGDLVVVQGGFLLDSQRQIEGLPSLLFPEGLSGVDLHSGHALPPAKAPAPGAHKH